MPGLLDVVALKRSVNVNGTAVAVPGISAYGIAVLLDRFPDLRRVLTGQKVDMNAAWLMENVPDAVAAVIAAGTGYPGEAEAEAIAASLSLEPQTELIEAIMEVTLPKGVGPFVERLKAMAEKVGVGLTSTAVTK